MMTRPPSPAPLAPDAHTWSELSRLAGALMHEVSMLMAHLTQPGAQATDEAHRERLECGARAARAADHVIERLLEVPEMVGPGKAVMCFLNALLAWHRAELDNSPLQSRHQRLLQQATVAVLATCLQVEARASDERFRLIELGLTPTMPTPRRRPQSLH